MTKYIIRRLLWVIVLLFLVSLLTFLIFYIFPSADPAVLRAGHQPSPELIASIRHRFGLDQPWYVQYGRWMGQLAHGDLGTSWRTGKPVLSLILERLPVTLELTCLAVGFSLLLGIAAGIVSATRRDGPLDNVTRIGTLLGLSVPVFWQGTMLILFFSLYLRWMPSVVWVDFATSPRANLTIMVLPAICLGTAAAANIAADARENFEDEDGTPTVLAGAGNSRVANLAFFPSVVTIRVGQSVRFLKTQDPTEPHTVTFGAEPTDPIAQLVASGGNTYNGTGTVNSGFLSTKAQYHYYQLTGTPLPVAVTRFTVTFTKAGTWDYICALHDGAGMRGKVIVLP